MSDDVAADDHDLDTRLGHHLGAHRTVLDVPDGSVEAARTRAVEVRRRTVAARMLASAVAVLLVGSGVVLAITGSGDDPDSSVDVAGSPDVSEPERGQPSVEPGPVDFEIEPLEPAVLGGEPLVQVESTDRGFVAITANDDFQASRLVVSDDGTDWSELSVPIQGSERINQADAAGNVVAVTTIDDDSASVAYVLRGQDAWQRIPFSAHQEPTQIIIAPSGDVLAPASVLDDEALRLRDAQRQLGEAVRALGPYDGYSIPDDAPDPLDTRVEIFSGSGTAATPTLRDLGFDAATAETLTSDQVRGSTVSSLLRSEAGAWVAAEVPEEVAGQDFSDAGDVVVAHTAGTNSILWSTDGITWEPVPAPLNRGRVDQVVTTDFGMFAVVNADQARFYRAETRSGPWTEIDTAPAAGLDAEGTTAGELTASKGAVVATTKRYAPGRGPQTRPDTTVTVSTDGSAFTPVDAGLQNPTFVLGSGRDGLALTLDLDEDGDLENPIWGLYRFAV